jgi:hypothetical protein
MEPSLSSEALNYAATEDLPNFMEAKDSLLSPSFSILSQISSVQGTPWLSTETGGSIIRPPMYWAS